MKTHLQNIVDIFAEPIALFTRLTSEPRWGAAYFLVCMVSIFVTWGQAPYEEQIISQSGQQTDIVEFRIGLLITLTFLRCGGALIEAVFIGAVLTAGARFFKVSEGVKFKHIYATLIHLFLIRGLGDLVNTALLLVFRDVASVTSPAEKQLLPGLHHLAFFIEEAKLRYLLSSFHIFTVWEIICLTLAIEIIGKVSRLQAAIVTLGIFFLNVLLAFIFLVASAS